MTTIQNIIEKLGIGADQFEIDERNGTIENAKLRLVGDNIAISGFENISKNLTDKFGSARDKDETHGEKMWTWDIDGVKVDLYLFEQHCYKLHLSLRL